MRYSQEEKRRMDQLISAFETCIAESEEFDIAYSERSGYVWLVIAECGENVFFPIFDYDDLLRSLISGVADDAGQDMLYETTPESIAKFRRTCKELRKILEALPEEEREEAFAMLDENMLNYLRKVL